LHPKRLVVGAAARKHDAAPAQPGDFPKAQDVPLETDCAIQDAYVQHDMSKLFDFHGVVPLRAGLQPSISPRP